MRYYMSDCIRENKKDYYMVRNAKNRKILPLQTKYLKYKTECNLSTNTVKRSAYILTFYMNYMHEKEITIDEVFALPYLAQQEHFKDFLFYIKAGCHTGTEKVPLNNTCNAYLKEVFEFYEFLIMEYEKYDNLKVLKDAQVTYKTSYGAIFKKTVHTFRGFLDSEESKGRIIEQAKIPILLEACNSLRDKLLIMMLAETGFRIGEVLGIKYTKDIEYEKKSFRVTYRNDNENRAFAKNNEYRRAKVSDVTFELLELYLAECAEELKNTEYLFVILNGKTKGKPMNVNAVYSILKTLTKKTGIEVTPHMLRHYFANERRKAGWDVLLISRALGHKHISTTERYLHIEDDELIEASEAFFSQTKGKINIGTLL